MVKARVNAVHIGGSQEETAYRRPHILSPNRVIMPHYDALVLTLCISGFDVHKVLVDLISATDLL